MQYPLLKPKYYFALFKQITAFVKAPHCVRDHEKSVKNKIYDTVGLFVLKMIFLVPVIFFFALVYDPENVQSQRMADRFSPLVLLLVGGFILPFVEEIAFRLSLKFSAVNFALTSSALLYYVLTKAIFHTKMSAVDESFFLRVSVAISFGGILYVIFNRETLNKKVASFWASNVRTVYYVSCIVFAWIHLSKYELIWLNVLLLPILTLPQLFSAIIYGYTRVVFGFKYPLFLHMTTNSVAIGLSMVATS